MRKLKLYGVSVEGVCPSDNNNIAFRTKDEAHAWCVRYWEPHEQDYWDDDWRETLQDLAWVHEIEVIG